MVLPPAMSHRSANPPSDSARPIGAASASTPVHAAALFSLALEHHRAEEPEHAERLYRATLAADPSHAAALYYLGLLCLRHHTVGEAIGYLDRALALRPDDADWLNDRGIAAGPSPFDSWGDPDDGFWKQLAEETEYHGVTPVLVPLLVAGDAGAVVLQDALETAALLLAGNLARDTDVIDGRHVDQEAAGQGDVGGDARAFLAERLLGNLNDDFLALY